MTDVERAYDLHLQTLYHAGLVAVWFFEAFKLKIGERLEKGKKKGIWFTPDFLVIFPDGRAEFHETKGTTNKKNGAGEKVGKMPLIEEAAAVRIAVSSTAYDYFPHFVVFKDNGNWRKEEI